MYTRTTTLNSHSHYLNIEHKRTLAPETILALLVSAALTHMYMNIGNRVKASRKRGRKRRRRRGKEVGYRRTGSCGSTGERMGKSI